MIVRAVKPIAKGEEVTVIKKNNERDCVCFFLNKKTCMYICICVSAENRFRTGNHPVPRAKRRQRHSPA